MMSATSGMTSMMTCPLGPSAASEPRRARRASRSSLSVRSCAHELAERLDERRVGDVALELIELARRRSSRARATMGLWSSWTSAVLPMPE